MKLVVGNMYRLKTELYLSIKLMNTRSSEPWITAGSLQKNSVCQVVGLHVEHEDGIDKQWVMLFSGSVVGWTGWINAAAESHYFEELIDGMSDDET